MCCVGVADRKIPIYPGIEKPLLVKPLQPLAPQSVALAAWPHSSSFPENQAIDFLRQTIRQNPGEITLLAIGPLTNIAALFTIDPEIATMLKSLVIMGGNYTPTRWKHAGSVPIEWNIANDPHAAAIVFAAPVPSLKAIGLDVTTQVTMPANEVRARFTHKLLRPVLDFSKVWFDRGQPTITFHDPLAATTIFDDQICNFERGKIDVELQSEKLTGFTMWNPREANTPHTVATSVHADRFFEHYFGCFK